jgi:hypothetical protein
MTKRSVAIGILLVLCLLAGCWYAYRHWMRVETPADPALGLSAVPVDAIGIQQFRSLALLTETYAQPEAFFFRFCPEENGLSQFLRRWEALDAKNAAQTAVDGSEALFSVHYTGKNQLSVLMASQLLGLAPEARDLKTLCDGIAEMQPYKRYNREEIFRLFGPESPLYMAIVENFLLASSSSVVLESAIRHLSGKHSLMDNAAFASLEAQMARNSDSRLFVHLLQADKLFSPLLGRKMQAYAPFVSKTASWAGWDGLIEPDALHLSGYLLTDKDKGHYFSTLEGQQPMSVKTWEGLPASTLFFMSFSLSDFAAYQEAYHSFLEIDKRSRSLAERVQLWEERQQVKLTDWLSSLYPEEIALARVPRLDEGEQWVTVIRSKHIQSLRKAWGFAAEAQTGTQILPNPHAGAFAAFFGAFFARCNESHAMIIDQMLFLGEASLLQHIAATYHKNNTLYSVSQKSRVQGRWMQHSSFTLMLQAGAGFQDSLAVLSDATLIPKVSEALKPYQHSFVLFQVEYVEGRPYTHLALSADTLKPRQAVLAPPSEEAIDTQPLPTVTGPFPVYNHATKKQNSLIQRPDSTLLLQDEAGKSLWRTRLKIPIADTVVQIDYLKNDKLQILFASEYSLQLLDRLGRSVSPYPQTLPERVRKGPFVFDLNKQKDYTLFLIHSNNSLCAYDRTGSPDAGWLPFTPEDRLESPPLLIPVAGGLYYWLVCGAQKDYVLGANGVVLVSLQKKQRLQEGSGLQQEADGSLKGLTREGKTITIHPVTAKIKVR